MLMLSFYFRQVEFHRNEDQKSPTWGFWSLWRAWICHIFYSPLYSSALDWSSTSFKYFCTLAWGGFRNICTGKLIITSTTRSLAVSIAAKMWFIRHVWIGILTFFRHFRTGFFGRVVVLFRRHFVRGQKGVWRILWKRAWLSHHESFLWNRLACWMDFLW